MPQDAKNNQQSNQKDDPRQAIEEGDPQITGRSAGRPGEGPDKGDANRANPDAAGKSGRKDVTATTPHRESGDQG
jgi:hypothetical protein